MKLDLGIPIKIIMIGAGGTGGYIAPHLYRIAHALKRKIRIIIADGDIVEEKNLIRQNFAPCDIGENKAKIIAERYSTVFGIETEYLPDFIESQAKLTRLIKPHSYSYNQHETVILIGAVDNNRSRKMCHKVFYKSKSLIYIDSGNGEYTGQVVCGIRCNGKTLSKPVGGIYPDILEADDLFPTELSCAERSISSPQSISANLFASTAVVSLLYQLLAVGELNIESLTFSGRTMNMKSMLNEGSVKSTKKK